MAHLTWIEFLALVGIAVGVLAVMFDIAGDLRRDRELRRRSAELAVRQTALEARLGDLALLRGSRKDEWVSRHLSRRTASALPPRRIVVPYETAAGEVGTFDLDTSSVESIQGFLKAMRDERHGQPAAR